MAGLDAGTLWGLVLAVHLLGMTAWVGGMAYALMVLRPALAVLDPAPRMQLHLLTLRRFFLVVWHAMPLTIAAGFAMVLGVYGGFAHLPWQVSGMMALGLVMAALFLFLFFGPYKRLRRAIRPSAEMLAAVRTPITINLVLGVVVIVIASLGHF